MTDPGRTTPPVHSSRRDLDPIRFTEAEKLAVQREAQHAAAARGPHVGGLGVQQYLAHERCTQACSAAGHPGHSPRPAAGEQSHGGRVPPPAGTRHHSTPDPHPRISDLWGWLFGPPPGSRDA